MTLKSKAIATKKILEEYGWIQGGVGSPMTGFCILGAAYYCNSCDCEFFYALRDKTRSVSIGAWNDKPGRTKEEVFAILTQIIEENP